MVIDAERVRAAPGVLLAEDGAILAAGAPETIGAQPDARVVDRPDTVVVPALVNAHCHLDLTAIGPVPYDGDFIAWIRSVRDRRAADDEALAAAVSAGIRLARAGGTILAGDIAGVGSRVPLDVMRAERLAGVSYREIFGIGRGQSAAIRAIEAAREERGTEHGVALGLQPHAPYSCGPGVYRAAARSGLPVATHLAELPEEIRFLEDASGPLAAFLASLGLWDDGIAPARSHPVDFLLETGEGAAFLAAHVNYCDDRHLDAMASGGVSVAYCPRASAYFGHPRAGAPAHAYRAMLERGVNVALGTDSILCLETPDRISVLDEMRYLFARDAADPRMLLRMATTNGARALGLDAAAVTLAPRGLGAIALRIDPGSDDDPLVQALRRDEPPEWVARS